MKLKKNFFLLICLWSCNYNFFGFQNFHNLYDNFLKNTLNIKTKYYKILDNFCKKNNIQRGYGITFKQKQQIINIAKQKFYKEIPSTNDNDETKKEKKKNFLKKIVVSRFSYELYNTPEKKRRVMDDYTQLTIICNTIEDVLKNLINNDINIDKDILIDIDQYIAQYNKIYLDAIKINQSIEQQYSVDPIEWYDYSIRNLKPENEIEVPLIYKNYQNFRHPLGKLYLNYSFVKEKFFGYKKLFNNEFILNTLLLLGFNGDPFLSFFDKEKYLKYLFNMYILGGIQLPEMLTILPSNGLLYLKLFMSLGILFDDDYVTIISGMVFFIGFGNYGYLKFELLNNIHGIFNLGKDFIKFITSLKKIQEFFNKSFIEKAKIFSLIIYQNLSIFNINFIYSKNNNKFSVLAKILKNNVKKTMEHQLKQRNKNKNIQYMMKIG